MSRFDYNLFGDQFNTQGQGTNDDYSNSTEGANLGYAFSPKVQLRFRTRHSTSRTGGQGEWNFSQGVALPAGDANLPPDTNAFSRQNNFLASTELSVAAGEHWYHRFSGYEYNHRDLFQQGRAVESAACVSAELSFCRISARLYRPRCVRQSDHSMNTDDYNRAGFNYQGEYWARDWARTVFGYEFEDENGFFGDPTTPPTEPWTAAQPCRLRGRVDLLEAASRCRLEGGMCTTRDFGNRGVPRVATSYLLIRGGDVFSGTRLRGSFSEGIKEPNFLPDLRRADLRHPWQSQSQAGTE